MEEKPLREFARLRGVELVKPRVVDVEAAKNIAAKYNYDVETIKANFDKLLDETEQEVYRVYLGYEEQYLRDVFRVFIQFLRDNGEITSVDDVADALGDYSQTLDKFFVSLGNGRRSRVGTSFERICDALFKELDYPFTEQPVINGKPDFVLPSIEHYQHDPIDCIIFTSKHTLRERWRQVVTEGTRGLGFFLATIDEKLSTNQLKEMHGERIRVVCPERIRRKRYDNIPNVISFAQFFEDHLDPAMKRWKRRGVI